MGPSKCTVVDFEWYMSLYRTKTYLFSLKVSEIICHLSSLIAAQIQVFGDEIDSWPQFLLHANRFIRMSFLHAWKAIEQLPFNCSIIVNINPKKIKLSSQKQPIAVIRNSFGSATKRRRQPKKCSKNRSNSKRKSAVSTKNEHFSDSICVWVCECVRALYTVWCAVLLCKAPRLWFVYWANTARFKCTKQKNQHMTIGRMESSDVSIHAHTHAHTSVRLYTPRIRGALHV